MHTRLIILMLFFTAMSFSQNRCGTTAHTQYMQETIPEFATAKAKVNAQTKQWINNNTFAAKTTITIPVVVHVVWNTNNQNISDTQIQSQIDVLNADFNRTNIDTIMTPSVWKSIATDCDINFCLATTDPNENITTGITRTQTSQNSFSMNGDPVMSVADGGTDPWPQNDYLNIWVCKLTGGILGYASQPSGWSNPHDGVVIGYNYFGLTSSSQYGKGRTTTHEVGHWLNLEHIWGDNNCGNDQISDTPMQEEENYSCPGFPHNANSCNTTNANGDMFMNYMDYTNDACMNLFTEGQKTRMIAAINQYRSELLNHNLCSIPNAIVESKTTNKKLIHIVDVLGRITIRKSNTPLFYRYDDGSVEKKIIIE